jgi:hypothetical protein
MEPRVPPFHVSDVLVNNNMPLDITLAGSRETLCLESYPFTGKRKGGGMVTQTLARVPSLVVHNHHIMMMYPLQDKPASEYLRALQFAR